MLSTDPTIIAALLGVVGVLLTILGRAWLAHRRREVENADRFKNALSPAIAELVSGTYPTASILHGAHERHLAAIADFRPFIRLYRRRRFEADVAQYCSIAEKYLTLGPLAVLAAEPPAQEGRLGLATAIQRLLTYAK